MTDQINQIDLSRKLVIWYRAFKNAEVGPLSVDMAKAFIVLEMASRNGDLPSLRENTKDSFPAQVAEKRAAFVNLHMDLQLTLFLPLLCKSPGDVVMWVYFLKMHSISLKVFLPNT